MAMLRGGGGVMFGFWFKFQSKVNKNQAPTCRENAFKSHFVANCLVAKLACRVAKRCDIATNAHPCLIATLTCLNWEPGIPVKKYRFQDRILVYVPVRFSVPVHSSRRKREDPLFQQVCQGSGSASFYTPPAWGGGTGGMVRSVHAYPNLVLGNWSSIGSTALSATLQMFFKQRCRRLQSKFHVNKQVNNGVLKTTQTRWCAWSGTTRTFFKITSP